MLLTTSVTRFGDLLDLRQLFKAFLTTIKLPQSPPFLGNICKGVKIIHFSSEIIFGQLLKTFGDFFWSHCLLLNCFSVTRCWNPKKPNKKCPKSSHTSFYCEQLTLFKISSKCCLIFGQLFNANLSARPFKNSPI